MELSEVDKRWLTRRLQAGVHAIVARITGSNASGYQAGIAFWEMTGRADQTGCHERGGEMSNKVSVSVGYTRGDIYEDYKQWTRKNLRGVDITVIDGLGNKLELNAREGGIGYRLSVNSETIAIGEGEK